MVVAYGCLISFARTFMLHTQLRITQHQTDILEAFASMHRVKLAVQSRGWTLPLAYLMRTCPPPGYFRAWIWYYLPACGREFRSRASFRLRGTEISGPCRE